jgi:hypothetical protein
MNIDNKKWLERMCVIRRSALRSAGKHDYKDKSFAVDVSNNPMEFMRLSTIKTDDRVRLNLNGLFSSAQSDIGKFFRKAVKDEQSFKGTTELSMEFIASNDALIAASHLHHLGRLFINKATIDKTMARSLVLFDRLAFVSIQSARLTGDETGLAMDESVAFLRMHGVEVDYRLQREYRPLVSSVRVRRQRTGVSGSSSASDSGSGSRSGSLRASTPVDLPPIPIVYDDATEVEDPVDGNDMDEDDYEEELIEDEEEEGEVDDN